MNQGRNFLKAAFFAAILAACPLLAAENDGANNAESNDSISRLFSYPAFGTELNRAYDAYGTEQFDNASKFAQRSCLNGGVRGCDVIVEDYLKENKLKTAHEDYEKALAVTIKRCANGDPDVCYMIESVTKAAYENGQYERAKSLATRLCEGGSIYGCGMLLEDYFLENRMYVQKAEYQGATAVLSKRCGDKDAESCAILDEFAEAHLEGEKNMRQNYKEAFGLYTKACADSKGKMEACAKVGQMYLYGVGVRQNSARASRPLRQACQSDKAGACYDLALLYKNGLGGVPKNTARAKELYGKSCDLGNQRGCDKYAKINLGAIRGHCKNDAEGCHLK